jgi:hypothetical protein
MLWTEGKIQDGAEQVKRAWAIRLVCFSGVLQAEENGEVGYGSPRWFNQARGLKASRKRS